MLSSLLSFQGLDTHLTYCVTSGKPLLSEPQSSHPGYVDCKHTHRQGWLGGCMGSRLETMTPATMIDSSGIPGKGHFLDATPILLLQFSSKRQG